MSWILGSWRRQQMLVASSQMWHNCSERLAESSGGRCFVFLERRLIRNFVLQGFRSPESRRCCTVAPPPPPPTPPNTDWKKKKKKLRPQASSTSQTQNPNPDPKPQPAVVQHVVVVESASKAKTIAKCLGPGFTVVPSHGHVRDLASRAGSVRPDHDFNMLWEVPASARPHINAIKAALKRAQVLVLASDPDREGEAIAWHVLEMLTLEGSLPKHTQVKRAVFHEITKPALTRAIDDASSRDVSETLVNAYLVRRALDYLIGFNLSPVLWRKLPGSRSAGRVQAAALRLICDREQEIEAFQRREFWNVDAELQRLDGRLPFLARLSHLKGEKLDDRVSISSDSDAQSACEYVERGKLRVESVKKGIVRRKAPVPYVTSSLQQDACDKLGFGAHRTMSIAQQLYEGVKLNDDEHTGLITYMRTDGVQISAEALDKIRDLVGSRYGQDYVPAERRVFVSKLRNALEAHEAIRPTDIFRLPSSVANVLEEDALQLYSLIWARTVACQMELAVSNQVSVYVVDDDKDVQLRAHSSSISFPGFLVAYKDTAALGKFVEFFKEEEEDGESTSDLNQLEPGDLIKLSEVRRTQCFTEPPLRFSEGTLVKKLEELGIGRPATYAPTLRTLQLRNYMQIREHRIFPEVRGHMVSAFLIHYFPEFSDFALTADMERQLDEVSSGRANWKEVLSNFWPGFHEDVLNAMEVPVNKVAVLLEELLAKQLFSSTSAGAGDRVCPMCKEGKVSLKLSRSGAGHFFGCSRHPDCLFKANMISGEEDKSSDDEGSETPAQLFSEIGRPPKVLGVDPATQLEVVMKVGPYGAYVQLGEASKNQKPHRTTLPKGVKAEEVTLPKALELLSYPRVLGKHPVEGSPIIISIGKFGFLLRHRAIIANVPQGVRVETLSIDKAVEILKGKNVSRRGRRPRRPLQVDDSSAQNSSPHTEGATQQIKTTPEDSNTETPPKGVKKRMRGRPRKNANGSEHLLVQKPLH